MDKYSFSIEKDVPAIGASDLSNKDSMEALLDTRIATLEELSAAITAQRDFLVKEIRAAVAIREVYKKMQ